MLLASVGAAPARNRSRGVLRMLGATLRQLRALVVWELAPVTVAAVPAALFTLAVLVIGD